MQQTLGQRISDLRKDKGITKAELSRRLGMSHVQIGKYELDESEPTAGVLKKLAETLDTTIDYLISGTEPIYRDPPFSSEKLQQYLKQIKELPLSDQKQVFHFLELIFLKRDVLKILSKTKLPANGLLESNVSVFDQLPTIIAGTENLPPALESQLDGLPANDRVKVLDYIKVLRKANKFDTFGL